MDGTLLGSNHQIAPETLKAIHRAQEAGIRFMIATGRNYSGAITALDGVDLTCDYLVGSGAEVRDPQANIISQVDMDKELCEDIYHTLQKYPISVIFCTEDYDYQIGTPEEIEECMQVHLKLFFLTMNEEEIKKDEMYQKMKAKTKTVSSLEELLALDAPIRKIFLFSEDVELLGKIEKDLSVNEKIAVASSFPTNLEITDVRAQKGPVLKEYIESLGYTMEEVMVFGDSMNDYSMLSMDFGATVAMENADDKVKAVSKYITKSNEEFGVAYAIDELLKRR